MPSLGRGKLLEDVLQHVSWASRMPVPGAVPPGSVQTFLMTAKLSWTGEQRPFQHRVSCLPEVLFISLEGGLHYFPKSHNKEQVYFKSWTPCTQTKRAVTGMSKLAEPGATATEHCHRAILCCLLTVWKCGEFFNIENSPKPP